VRRREAGCFGQLKAKSRGDEQKPDMRRDAFGTSGHVTAKSSIYKWVATPARVHFVNPASMRGRIRVLPREICHVSVPRKRQRLKTGELVLSAWQKSADGIVGAARTEGLNLER
jgi:hypothetical protein